MKNKFFTREFVPAAQRSQVIEGGWLFFMKKNPYYRLKYIAGIPYLITFGQGNADFKHDMRLNETSVFLWEQMEKVSDTEGLVALCADHFQCSKEDYPVMEASIRQFVNSLYQQGILLPKKDNALGMTCCRILKIAGLFLKLYGPEIAFAKELLDFKTNEEFSNDSPIQEICVQTQLPTYTENGMLLLRNQSLSVVEGVDHYLLLFPELKQIREAHVDKDGKRVIIYCLPDITTETTVEISYVIRIAFLYFAQLKHMIAIHSASILYRDKVWLFSAPSGTGKTTHTKLWQEAYQTPVINGDLNLIAMENGIATVHGIPWCGTSGIYSKQSYPLGGIIFLTQDADNKIISLSEEQKQLRLLHRSISPGWKEEMQESNYSVVEELSDKILICHLTCNQEKEAAVCCKRAIDTFFDNNLQFC